MNVEIAVGGEFILSDHIISGIEFKANYVLFNQDWAGNYFSAGIFGKYYFEKLKKPKKK